MREKNGIGLRKKKKQRSYVTGSWVSKRVKKERFKNEEYKRERERERRTFESLNLIPIEHCD